MSFSGTARQLKNPSVVPLIIPPAYLISLLAETAHKQLALMDTWKCDRIVI